MIMVFYFWLDDRKSRDYIVVSIIVAIRIAISRYPRYRRQSRKASGSEEGGRVGENELADFWQWLLRRLLLLHDNNGRSGG